LPRRKILSFAEEVKSVCVIEELDPFLEGQIKAMGVHIYGKAMLPHTGELGPGIIRRKLWEVGCWVTGLNQKETHPDIELEEKKKRITQNLPLRPPVLCPGCPHRGVFYVLKKLKLTAFGDIGCYTLAALPPLEAMDTCVCMGAGVGGVLGFEKASVEHRGKAVAVIGDSTFVHSGITPLIDIVYNKGCSTVIILDNRTTAMTGQQDHPGTGITLKGEKTKALDFISLGKAVGVGSVVMIDPYDLEETERVIKEEVAREASSLIISNRPCVLVEKFSGPQLRIDEEECVDCGLCLRLGCPALSKITDGVQIDSVMCVGCELCVEVCNLGAVKKEGAEDDN